MKKEIKRSEVLEENTWDLTRLVKDESDFNQKLDMCYKFLDELVTFKGHILDSSKTLLDFYKKSEEYDLISNRIYIWAYLNIDTDTTDSKKQSFGEKVTELADKEAELLAFISPEMLSVPYSKVLEYIEDNKELEIYRQNLKDLYRYQEHTLTKTEEELLGKVSSMLGNNSKAFAKLNNADVDFGNIKDENNEEVKLTHANFGKYIESKERSVRKQAFTKIHEYYKKHINTFTVLYSGQVTENCTNSKIRKYNSSLEASLYSDNIPVSFYKKLLETVHNNLEPMYKYLDIRKNKLGLDELHMYDMHINIADLPEQKFTFEEGKEIVLEALKPLGETYINDLKQAFTNRWIDKYPNKGKRSGAYEWNVYDEDPYVLLNFNGTLESVSTMAHELGHAMHSYYSDKYQPFVYHDYPIVLAEIASTVNEVLLNEYLLKNAKTKEEKIYHISDLLNTIRATIYRQLMFAEFEMKIHELKENSEPITEQVLSNTYYELNKLYYGNDVVSDDLIRYEWARIPHFYTAFYVYKYATGLSAALAFASRILNNEENALEEYLTFLSSGGSKDPFDILKDAGLDMESGKPLEEALKLFSDKVNELEELLK